ncbi:MAG TPA: tetratricopeptide repeat protein [Chitinophagaceae bacterium]|nr:tetratricopeptide repeat protein [Chitinophagaceae bacterium]
MKRMLFSSLLALVATGLFAQKVDKAKDLLKAGKLAEARAEIDAFLAQEKNQKNADAWYTKAKIYGAMATDEKTKGLVPDPRMESFQALKKYTEVDDKMLITLQIDGYKPINDIYTGYYQDGANSFNAKDYEKSYAGFKNAIEVSKFMTEKGWINLKLDTNSVLYAGVSAEKLNKPDEAAIYYGQLAENKIKGEGFVEIYKWVANHHYEKKDIAAAQKYIDLGKEVYPSDPFWASLELDMTRESGDKNALFSKYEQTIASNPDNHLYRYNYAVELYQHGYNVDSTKRPANSAELIGKAAASVKEALRIKPDYARAQLFAGQISYNQGVDILNGAKAIKGTKPEEVKKKADLRAEAVKKFDEAIPYFLEVEKLLEPQGKLKMEDKSDLKEAYDLLITIYDQKGMKDKVKEYEVKFNDVDRKH